MNNLYKQALSSILTEEAKPDETLYKVTKEGAVETLGNITLEEASCKCDDDSMVMTKEDFKALYEAKKKKPSAGLSKKKKSAVAKKARKGEDIGKKGKGFETVAKKAAKEYGSKEAGERVAAAAMWKNVKR